MVSAAAVFGPERGCGSHAFPKNMPFQRTCLSKEHAFPKNMALPKNGLS
jgi:hypothetical protein